MWKLYGNWWLILWNHTAYWASLVVQLVKKSICNARDPGWIPGGGRSLGEGNGSSLQYSCLENLTDRGAWWATVQGVTKSWMWQRTHTHTPHTMDLRAVCAWTGNPGTPLIAVWPWIRFFTFWSMPSNCSNSIDTNLTMSWFKKKIVNLGQHPSFGEETATYWQVSFNLLRKCGVQDCVLIVSS